MEIGLLKGQEDTHTGGTILVLDAFSWRMLRSSLGDSVCHGS